MENENRPPDQPTDLPAIGKNYTEKFIIRDLLGKGGIGQVFLAVEKNIDREVAIKELIPEKSEKHKDRAIARFLREAKLSGKLQHPNIVPVYQMGTKSDGTPYYVMKYVEGENLNHMLKECNFDSLESSFRRRISYLDNLIAISEAMGYAHAKGIIHRDLKPHNIIVGKFGETIILDWGLAKQIWENEPVENDLSDQKDKDADASEDFKTRDGAVLGTPSYMAPEQIDSKFGEVDARTDVYALGGILFMILTGDKPYHGNAEKAMELIVSDNPSPSPLDYGKFIPPELAAICQKAMSKSKSERFANGLEFASELRAYRDGRLVSAYSYSRGELFKRFVARNKIILSAIGAIMLSIMIGGAFSFKFAVDAQHARMIAESALQDVTDLSESTMVTSRQMTQSIGDFFEGLTGRLQNFARQLALTNLADQTRVIGIQESLAKEFPSIEAIVVSNDKGEITAASPPNYDSTPQLENINPKKMEAKFKSSGFAISKAFNSSTAVLSFVVYIPIYSDSSLRGVLSAVIRLPETLPANLPLDPVKSELQVWVMQDDGIIIYDEDTKQIGLDLFTSRMYANYPELLKFGEQIQKEPWGVGNYSFFSKKHSKVIYKVASWDTLEDPVNWKVVVTHPYIPAQ